MNTDFECPNPKEKALPFSAYDVKVCSSDGSVTDLLGGFKGKVTLLFNVAAGCGNIPQHSVLQELNMRYSKEPDFNVVAIVVDDFVCHGYPEFQDGIAKYIETNNLSLSPGQVAQQYAETHFDTSYAFSELTAGRHDKHTYAADYVPGELLQEQHSLWSLLTGAWAADVSPSGVPYHAEHIPWSVGEVPVPVGAKTFAPLCGNFEKFLISRDGTRIRRYANGFLLGERDWFGNTFPWVEERYQENGLRDYRPNLAPAEDDEDNLGNWPTKRQRKGIEFSLDVIKKHIDEYLAE